VRFVLDEPERDALLRNDGRGTFTAAPPEWAPTASDSSNFTLQALDVDGDGDVDIVAPNTVFERAAGATRVLLNDGSARFTLAAPNAVLPAAANGNGFDIEVADFDGDEQLDLFLCNRASTADAVAAGGVQRLLLGRAR
jgi:hypothetical protein